jgi:hypothetical protein
MQSNSLERHERLEDEIGPSFFLISNVTLQLVGSVVTNRDIAIVK